MPAAFGLWFSFFLIYHAFILIFTNAGPVGFGDMASALAADLGWAAFFAGLTGFAGSAKGPGYRIFNPGIAVLLGLFCLTAFGFARLYERPFTWAFIRTDTISIWKENFISAVHEFGLPHTLLLLVTAGGLILALRKAAVVAALPRRFLGINLIASAAVIFLSWMIQPRPPGLIANPLTASFGQKPHTAQNSVAVGMDDVIPDLESPAPEGYLKAIDLPRGHRKNIILYFLESTSFSVIGKKVRGKELTPNLNRLKERSRFFNRHYANFPLSINAFYNAVCGAYALPDGAWISLSLPDFPVPCLSGILKKRNYRTIGLHAGYLGYAKQKRFMQKHDFDVLGDADTLKKPPYEKGMGPWGAADERAIIKPLTEFAAADPQKPFLAVLFAFAPHHPYDMPDDYPELVADTGEFKKQQRNYFNSLHFADHAFGEIIAGLEKKGLMKDTILIAFGDHGEAFYEHRGNYNHPFFIYEENVRVPLFIWFDGIKPGEENRVTSHVDILPTVLDLLGYASDISPMHVGRSMLKGGAPRMAHLQAFWQEEFSGIVDARYKFIRKETGARELYDLAADAGETMNLAAQKPDLAEVYNLAAERAFAQKRAYYKKYANYDLVRFKPSSQDK